MFHVKTDGGGNCCGGLNTGNGSVAELNESNNTASVPITLSRPDLAISNLQLVDITTRTDASYVIRVSFRVSNLGQAAIAQSAYLNTGYLSSTGVLDDTSTAIYGAVGAALAPGAFYDTVIDFYTFAGIAPGSYTFFVKTDGGGNCCGGLNTGNGGVAELNESNNTASLPVTLP